MNRSLFKTRQGKKWLLDNRQVAEGTIEKLKAGGKRYGRKFDIEAAELLQRVAPAGVIITPHIVKDFRLKVGLKAYSKKPKVVPINLSSKLAEKLAEGSKVQTRIQMPSEHRYSSLARTSFPRLYYLLESFIGGPTMLLHFATAVAAMTIEEEYRREHEKQSGGQPDGQETPAPKT